PLPISRGCLVTVRLHLLTLGLGNPICHQLQSWSLTHYLVLFVDLPQLLMQVLRVASGERADRFHPRFSEQLSILSANTCKALQVRCLWLLRLAYCGFDKRTVS